MYYDYHIHTGFSSDGRMELRQACAAAIAKDVVEIAVTDHLDIDYPDSSIEFDLDYTLYSDAIDRARESFGNKISIIKGIEIGVQPHVIKECVDYLEDKDFQFIIASVHAVKKMDLHNGEFCANRTKKETYFEYLQEVYRCVDGFSRFNVLGHIDLIRRYGDYRDRSLRYPDYSDILDEIFRLLISTGRGLEINTSGFRYNLSSTMPDFDLIKRYRELGGEILTIGSDAHTPSQVAERFPQALDIARSAGFRYISRFSDGNPEFVKI
ncbi:MAG: Histidinol-phosphatase [Firmicutes bacterium]|nr:Histidinol-phosphatase [Bacillota bacterium]MDI6705554.1 histidinol-phosphatase HisJ family protein [Bacillota bacterium]